MRAGPGEYPGLVAPNRPAPPWRRVSCAQRLSANRVRAGPTARPALQWRGQQWLAARKQCAMGVAVPKRGAGFVLRLAGPAAQARRATVSRPGPLLRPRLLLP